MKLASIERIIGKKDIIGADKIELVQVLGWNIITKKNEYQIGDLCVYIPIDTTIDPTRKYFNFLADKKNPTKRIKIEPVKIKGVFSEGLIIPIEYMENNIFKEGDDVSELFDVKKYEKETIINQISGVSAQKNIPFPTEIINITDEDNLKTKYECINEFIDEEVYITLKMDGSSMTIINNILDNNTYVCSRRLVLDEGSVMYQYVQRENILEKIKNYNIAIQGEFCGPKINGNKMKLKNYKYYVFNIKDLNTNKYLGWYEIKKIADKLQLETVPLLQIMDFKNDYDLNYFQEMANKLLYTLPSNICVPAEGLVIRPTKPKWSNLLSKFLSVKIINQNYKD